MRNKTRSHLFVCLMLKAGHILLALLFYMALLVIVVACEPTNRSWSENNVEGIPIALYLCSLSCFPFPSLLKLLLCPLIINSNNNKLTYERQLLLLS